MRSEIKERLVKYNTPRRIVQFLSFIFFSAIVFNLGALALLLPVLWTWGLQPNTVGDAFTALQFLCSGWPPDNPVTFVVFPWLALASFLIVGVLIGKAMCGWVCPFGFVQDLLGFVKRKHMEFSVRTHENTLYVKYAILGITLFISGTFGISRVANVSRNYESGIGIFAYAPFTTLSPAETLFATIPRMISSFANAITTLPSAEVVSGIAKIPVLFYVQFVVLVAVLILVALIPRSWCRYFCPHGAFLAIMNRFSFIGLRRDLAKCEKDGCRACVEVCPMRISILDLPWQKFSDPECIYCMKCVDACKDKAIRLKYP